MSGLRSRSKGRRAETEAAHLLTERGYAIIELGPGRKTEDIVAESPTGCRVSCEVKNHLTWSLTAWRSQAKAQAKARRCGWLLLCRVPQMPGTFYVEGTDVPATVWRGNAARAEG